MAGDLVAECVHDCVQDVVKESTGLPLSSALYPYFGDGSSATIPVWTLGGPAGRIEVEVTFDAPAMGATAHLLVDADGGTQERLIKTSADIISFAYTDTGGATRYTTVNSYTISAGERVSVIVEFHGAGVTVTVNGVSDTNPNLIDPADLNIFRLGANDDGDNGFLFGTYRKLSLVDLGAPANSRAYDFGTPGRISEVLGGGADATLVNLDASDW